MSIVTARKTQDIARAGDKKAAILEAIGDLSNIKVMQNMVLVATYIRPETTSGGIVLPDSALDEDVWQGKVGLVLKLGPVAFETEDGDGRFYVKPNIHDWCVYRVGDAWDITVNKVACRLIADQNVRLVIDDPESIF